MIHRNFYRTMLRWTVVVGLCAVVMACTTPDRVSIGSFREGLVAAQSRSKTLFDSVNEMVRQLQLSRVDSLTNLRERDFAPALDVRSRRRWSQSFEALGAYASALEVLTDPQTSEGVKASVGALGERIEALRGTISEGSIASGPSGGLVAAFGELSKLIVNAQANKEALRLMRQADPHVRNVLTHMASMIGDDPTVALTGQASDVSEPDRQVVGGVRLTVWSNRTAHASLQRTAFLDPQNAGKKRSIAAAYADALAARDAADSALAGLRLSLLNLADVHTASSQGRQADAASIIAFLRHEIDTAGQLIEMATKKGKNGG